MARKSRKTSHILQTSQKLDAKGIEQWETAAYARLSVENGGCDSEDTIQTQIDLLHEYIAEHEELELVDTYIDNGYSGTNFHRPDFERMIEDIRKNRIRCIVVKDLSRFGRDYLETGYYIETIFPFLRVRLIAINDNFDSIRKDDVESLAFPIKNMVNAMYAKDISKKIYSAKHAKMKKAIPMSIMAPYGYFVNEERNRYEVDPDTAWCVKLIFHWALEGVSCQEIAKRLDLAEVPTRSQRLIKIGINIEEKQDSHWTANSIKRILTHPVYTGAMVSGRYEQALFAGREKNEKMEQKNWMITEGTHEPIVDKEDYEAVEIMFMNSQDRKKEQLKRKETFRMERPDELKGMVFCANCGTQMKFCRNDERVQKNGNYYRCCGIEKGKTCNGHRIPELLLKTLIMDEVNMFMNHLCDSDKLMRDLCRKQNDENPLYIARKKVSDATALVEQIRKKRERIYEDYVNGTLDADDYVCLNRIYLEQFQEANVNLETVTIEKQNMEQRIRDLHSHAAEVSDLCSDCMFNKELVEKLVERVEVGWKNTVHIVFKFNDVFEEVIYENTETRKGRL